MNNDLRSTFSSDFKAFVTEVVSKLIWNTDWQSESTHGKYNSCPEQIVRVPVATWIKVLL